MVQESTSTMEHNVLNPPPRAPHEPEHILIQITAQRLSGLGLQRLMSALG